MKKFYLFSSNDVYSELSSIDNSDHQMFPFVLHFLGALKGIETSKFLKFHKPQLILLQFLEYTTKKNKCTSLVYDLTE